MNRFSLGFTVFFLPAMILIPAQAWATAPHIWDYRRDSSPLTEWSQAIRTRVILRTKDCMVLYCVRIPKVKQRAYWKAPENMRLQLDDMNLGLAPMTGLLAKTLPLKRWDLIHLPADEEWREVWLEDPQPKPFLWLLAPPRMPAPMSAAMARGRLAGLPPPPNSPETQMLDIFEDVPMSRKANLPATAWMLASTEEQTHRPPPPVWFLGQMVEQARKLALQEGQALFIAPFESFASLRRISASLMIVNGAAEWMPPDGESLLFVLDGEAEIPAAEGGSKTARVGNIVSIPGHWGQELELKGTGLGSFCALLVTIRRNQPARRAGPRPSRAH
ncbi:MAG: hypothetical protein PHU21_08940 [Elusimicrobia bacterium]|nr:hypothetical protein [Elusimicrobiota bacterium]